MPRKSATKSEQKPVQLTSTGLFNHLYEACNNLRGPIGQDSFKDYVTPLLYYKRISDVWDEEYARAMQESGNDEEYASFPEQHAFVIPDGCHWEDLRQRTENVGSAILGSMREIERCNPTTLYGGLTGIFGASKLWTNKDTMPDELLTRLIEHFSEQNLSIAACPADEMGTAYEYLIGKFADDAGHTAQEFYTNRTVVELMARILKPQSHDSIYDPTCGSGGMLIKCLTSLKDQGKEWRDVRVYGPELNAITSSIARMNLMLHGMEDFTIINADTLTNPAFLKAGKLQQFDIVLANPPYSIKQWNREMFANDPFGRNIWGTPPQGRADYAFFQHIVCSMKPDTGRCAILFPHGVLFRDEEREMREKLIKSDLIECVIGLGPNLFFNSPMEACIVICRSKKTKHRQGKIFFINAVNEVVRKNAESTLEPEHIQRIVNAYQNDQDVDGFSKLATLEEIAANHYSLAISLYAYAGSAGSESNREKLSLEQTIQNWLASSEEATASFSKLVTMLEDGGNHD